MTLKKIIPGVHVPVATSVLFFMLGLACILITCHAPVKDFGNYYYGSRLLLNGKFDLNLYTNIAHFNEQISAYGERNFFENYIPVPPFSALFYAPFCLFKSITAKLIFNLLSLLLFCISFKRLMWFLKIERKAALLVPLIFVYPLLNNMLQGQSYLLLAAALAEVFIATERSKTIYPSVLTALIILLKIFPVFILLYFLLKKNYKVFVYALCFVLLFFGISMIAIPPAVNFYYVMHVLPRLFNNDIVGAYYSGNQSLYTLLLNLFSYDALNNPTPFLNNPVLVPILESVFTVSILAFLFEGRLKSNLVLFSLVLLCVILVSRYTTTYAMLFLIPVPLLLLAEKKKNRMLVVILLCLAVFINLPVGSFIHYPLLIRFSRLLGLMLIFILTLCYAEIKLNYKVAALLLLPVFVSRYLSFSIQPVTYFPVQNTKGILYDLRLNTDSLTLKSTLGDETLEETLPVAGKLTTDPTLLLTGNRIYYKGKLLCDSKDNKLNPFIFNDTAVVFMSDMNQGIRFYKLRSISRVK